jgi:hypothetical protein
MSCLTKSSQQFLTPAAFASGGDLPIGAVLYAQEHTVELQGAKAGGGVSGHHGPAARPSVR